MKTLSAYLFSDPLNGQYLIALPIIAGLAALTALGSALAIRRAGFVATRRRARRLRNLTIGVALVSAVLAAVRYAEADYLGWRIWMYLLLGYFVVRLVSWALSLRSLEMDKVEEQQARRRQSYFKRSGKRRPTKRKRRR